MINCRLKKKRNLKPLFTTYEPSITYDMYHTLSESGIKTTHQAVKQAMVIQVYCKWRKMVNSG